METTPVTGKSRQSSHEPLRRKGTTGTCHTDKTVEKREGQGRGDGLQGVPTLRKTLRLRLKMPTKLIRSPMDQEQKESWRMRITNKPLTAKVKLVLLVVNFLKLHLTAFYNRLAKWRLGA